jgi:hypothetical protein
LKDLYFSSPSLRALAMIPSRVLGGNAFQSMLSESSCHSRPGAESEARGGSREDGAIQVLLARKSGTITFWYYTLLHGQGGYLSASSPARATHWRKADDAEDRAQASHVADPSQTVSPQDAMFFPLALHARPAHRVIYEPCGIRLCRLKRNRYQIGTLPPAFNGSREDCQS